MRYLYKESLDTAKSEGDVYDYNASLKENIRCKEAIDAAISEHFDGKRLDPIGAKKVLAEFGYDRTMWVLAASVRYKPDDGRFSRDTRNWANSIIPTYLPKYEFGDYFSDAHPAVLDGFIGQVRREYEKLGLLSEKDCICEKGIQNYEKQLLILRPENLNEQHRNPNTQYFYAKGGFGCYPDRAGGKVFGKFLCDGETANFYRDQFIGIADREQLPKWAVKRLEILEAPKMKIRIFQIDHDKDTHGVKFMNMDFTNKHGGVNSETYHQAYGGTVIAENLEDIFRMCNEGHPPGYFGHSLSVSDVVEICEGREKGFYFCDKVGFKKLEDFDIEKTDHADMMKILVLENDRAPYVAEIRQDIHAMQSVVGGNIEPVYFEPKGDAMCWCNDEFLLNSSVPNRRIGDVLIHGTCYISGDHYNEYGERDSCSLTDEQIKMYSKMFPQSVIVIENSNDEDMSESEDQGQSMS